MKTVYVLKGLDCPHCAGQIEQEVGQLPGVAGASVNLMQQTLTVETENAGNLLETVRRIVRSHEPEVVVTEVTGRGSHTHKQEDEPRKMLARLAIGGVLFAAGVILWFTALPKAVYLAVLVAAYGVLGFDVVGSAARNVIKGRVLDENFLMSLSSIGAFCIGEHLEAVAVMLFYQVGEYFQARAVQKSRRSIAGLMDLRPEFATVKRGMRFVTADPETVKVGDVILVKPGEKIPLDGLVLEGTSMLDTRALTGEFVPRPVRPGEEVLSGCVNGEGALHVQVTKPYGESTVSRILELVENASGRKAKTEQFITRFAKVYTPVVVILAVLLAVIPPLFVGGWTEWIHRGFVFLVISCPCALVISIPLAFFGGVGAASRHGVLVKGSNFLEALNQVDTVVFDKTGTLTQGVFQVQEVLPAPGFTSAQVLELAATAETMSNHPIAKSILNAWGQSVQADDRWDYKEIPGRGICAAAEGKRILAGSDGLLAGESVAYTPCQMPGTKVYVAADGVYAGCVVISDRVKPDAKQAIRGLKEMGIRKTVMLTGDEEANAAALARELELDGYHARLLPDEKVAALEQLDREKHPGKKIAFVGDGINDAPVLARADVGIAMGALGSDAAIEAADVVLMTDEPGRLLDALRIAKATRKIVVQNIVLALGVKGVFLLLGALGAAGMWEAVFADVGVALLAVCNAMRILKK